jgi:hypothetical protein
VPQHGLHDVERFTPADQLHRDRMPEHSEPEITTPRSQHQREAAPISRMAGRHPVPLGELLDVAGAPVSLERADRVCGAAELSAAAPPEAGAAGFGCRTVVGVADESVPVGELVVAAAGESVLAGEPEPVPSPSTLPTLVPP